MDFAESLDDLFGRQPVTIVVAHRSNSKEIAEIAVSAGILVYRRQGEGLEFLLAHPGGPFWRRRDAGVWSVPKGLIEPGEALLDAALREFSEETGLQLAAPLVTLAPIRQAAGKIVHCWAAEADLDLSGFRSNTFEMEWPPRSGRWASFPEIDRLRYIPTTEAMTCVLASQIPLIDQVLARVAS